MNSQSNPPRPFQSYLVEWMEAEIARRKTEYLDDRERAHQRFAELVNKIQEELFMYRSTKSATALLSTVDDLVTRLRGEEEELRQLRERWKR